MTAPTIKATPRHVAALAEIKAKSDRIRYAVEHAPHLSVPDLLIWLSVHGANPAPQDKGLLLRRPYAAGIVKSYREGRRVTDTGDLPQLTPALLAELDAVTPDRITGDPVQTEIHPVQTEIHPDDMDDVTPVFIEPPAVEPITPTAVEPEPEPVEPPAPAADPVTPPAAVEPATPPARPVRQPLTGAARVGTGALLTLVAVLLAGVIVAPIALSSQDIIDWAASQNGLGLTGVWPIITFLSLDAAAAVCVGLVVYCAWRGESAGIFAWLVWAFAGMSAFANYSHGSTPGAARDAIWFFPIMSLAGPFLLEMIVRRVRKWVQEGTGQRVRASVSFGFARWVPGVGALRETYGAWRLARLDAITDANQAVKAYRELCPTGSVRVLKALRERR